MRYAGRARGLSTTWLMDWSWSWLNFHGLNRDSNPGPLAPKARIIPLDHWAAEINSHWVLFHWKFVWEIVYSFVYVSSVFSGFLRILDCLREFYWIEAFNWYDLTIYYIRKSFPWTSVNFIQESNNNDGNNETVFFFFFSLFLIFLTFSNFE